MRLWRSKREAERGRPARLRAERAGRLAEWVAAAYLRLQFYTVLAERYRTPVGELDIVARRGRTLVFVEVKGRARVSDEEDALRHVNRRRIARAAAYFLARHPDWASAEMRFDVIFLAPYATPRHVKGAFDAPEPRP